MDFVEVEVFTDTPGKGNPAGVVLAPSPLDDAAQRRWAEAVRKPGNGFLWPAGGGVFHARFHPPGREVGLSGHTALASAHALLEGPLRGRAQATLRSRSEDLAIAREGGLLWLTLPRPVLDPFEAPLARIAHALGADEDVFPPEAQVVRTNDGDLLLPLSAHIDPLALVPDPEALAAIGVELGTRGFCVYTQRTNDPASHVQSRFFVPHLGLVEDVATGSVHGPLAAQHWRTGRLSAPGAKFVLTGEQGDALGRPCRLKVELTIEDGALARLRVGGQTVTVSERVVEAGEL
jgi:PhzF family phenazine biosynthesis protein